MSFANYITNLALRAFSLLPSGAKTAIYPSSAASIGGEVEIGPGAVLIPFSRDFRPSSSVTALRSTIPSGPGTTLLP
ncbi:MAG: hypothetical protein JXA08_04595 [Methanomicrobiaceae archaeon]|nr:hypothetical protein [Methanomicrobiaceae archaeon]